MAEIGVIGAGSWGTALAVVLAHNGHNVTVWSILEDEVEMLTKEHEHKDKLPGVKIPETISFTTDLKTAAAGKEMVILAVPSPFTRSTAHNLAEFITEGQLIVIVSKGIEESTLMIQSEIVEQRDPAGGCGSYVRSKPCRRSWTWTADNRCGRCTYKENSRAGTDLLYE